MGVVVGTWLDPQILNLTPLPPLAFISVSPSEMEEVANDTSEQHL